VRWSFWASWNFDIETRRRPTELIVRVARVRVADLYAFFILRPM
jgi:hypothetical protein